MLREQRILLEEHGTMFFVDSTFQIGGDYLLTTIMVKANDTYVPCAW